MINYEEEEIKNCSNWVKKYLEKYNIKGIVIGLSGGIDSAVSAYICSKAVGTNGIGNKNIIGTFISCDDYSTNSMNDAKLLAQNLGINFTVFSIKETFENLCGKLNPKLGNTEEFYPYYVSSLLSQSNIKSRLRMIVLYALANECNYLVCGTTNKTESEIGYYTKFGDGGVDMEPLLNFYKYEIYEMAKFMPEIPQSIIVKPPSADLYMGQTDEQEIGITYDILDRILMGLNGEYELLKNIDTSLIDKVKEMKKKANHKNNLPPSYKRE